MLLELNLSEECINHVRNLVSNCIKIKIHNSIYYISNDIKHISRQLKYKNILKNNKEIKINIFELKYDDIILELDTTTKNIYVNYKKIFVYIWYNLPSKIESFNIIFDVMDNILNIDNYKTNGYLRDTNIFNIIKNKILTEYEIIQ